jgi:hypothetical protein
MDITITDEPEDTAPSDLGVGVPLPPTVDGLWCEVCSAPLTYGGRGRKPRFCAEHKPKASAPTGKRSNSVDVLIAQIVDFYAGIGTVVTLVPGCALDGMTVAGNATKLGESWRPLIERDPKLRKFWERMLTGSGYGALAFAHIMVALPIMANHGLLPKQVGEMVGGLQ